jgi:hypothetical protein
MVQGNENLRNRFYWQLFLMEEEEEEDIPRFLQMEAQLQKLG